MIFIFVNSIIKNYSIDMLTDAGGVHNLYIDYYSTRSPLHNHSFVVSIRTLHVLKRTRNERCTVPTPCGELCASLFGLLPYLPETS